MARSLSKIGSRKPALRGFSLIELVGVLAVLVIVAALLLPRLRQALNQPQAGRAQQSDARVADAVMACDTIRAAVAAHLAQYPSLAMDGSRVPAKALIMPPAIRNYDRVLIREQLLDKPFAVKLGDGSADTLVQALSMTGPGFALGAAVDGSADTGFALAGRGANSITGSVLVEAVITGVTAADAKELNDRIDGAALGAPLNGADYNGRVKYSAPVSGTTTVYVYLAHR
jgi:type II secretory pathway pseudopilin PulG